MDWASPDLRRFDFTFPDLPSADQPPVTPLAAPPRSFDVVCYGVSSEKLLSLTHSSHPLFSGHCYTGLQTYSGAEVLARLMLRWPAVLQGGRAVMEVGCGIGLTGVVAAHCMSRQTTSVTDSDLAPLLLLTDGEDDAVRLARCNLAINLASADQPADESTALTFLRSPLALSAQLAPPLGHSVDSTPVTPSIHVLSARWCAAGVSAVSSYCQCALRRPARFDVVFGADLLYARTAVSQLLDFAVPLLSDTGIILLAHTPRIAQLHSDMRAACRQRALTVRYVNQAAVVSPAEERERGWTQVEVAVIAADRGWQTLRQSADWQWAEFDEVGRVEQQLAEEAYNESDDCLVLGALAVSSDDL